MPDLLTPQQQLTLAERIRRLDPSAEDEFVRLFASRITFLARRRTHDPEVARDLAQDVMLAAICALRNGHLRDAERLTAFVYGTARNVINSYLRTRRRLPREEPIDAALLVAGVHDPLESTERRSLVRRALLPLDPADRRILLLTLVEGLKPGEIAARLGLSSDVVRARKSRAVKKAVEYLRRLSRT